MSNASDVFENKLALLYFMATTWDGIAENDTTGPLTSLQDSLHTASPADSGSQTTSEIAYTSYARAGVSRSASGFNVTGGVVTQDAPTVFPQGSGGSGTATHFGRGAAASGAGELHIHGALSPNIVCGNGVIPQIDITVTID
jgi:hypothetical protein